MEFHLFMTFDRSSVLCKSRKINIKSYNDEVMISIISSSVKYTLDYSKHTRCTKSENQ